MIIEEKLYDSVFVDQYVHGWKGFAERVMKDYSLKRVEEITWVDRELIRKAARMYAKTKPAARIGSSCEATGLRNWKRATP